MKFLIQLVTISALAFLGGMFLPWWVAAIAGFLGGMVFNRGAGKDFATGFLAIFLVWAGFAFFIWQTTGSPLPGRVAELFRLGSMGPIALVFVTGIIGGLSGGLGSLTGGQFKKMVENR